MTPPATVQQLFDLTGKTALVTGATGNLGSAISTALAEAGARVIATSRDKERAETFAATLPDPGDVGHAAIALDHLDETSIDKGFDEALELAGGLAILINNANEAVGKDLTDVTSEEFDRTLANATAYFLLARRLRDHAVEQNNSASIIMLGSMYGLVASYPDAYAGITPASPVAYHALKGGIIQMTRHLAAYWASDGIRVNCLSPGPFPADSVSPELVERLTEKVPMKRMGKAHELKGAAVFLASEASSYVTGHNLVIDGGWTAW